MRKGLLKFVLVRLVAYALALGVPVCARYAMLSRVPLALLLSLSVMKLILVEIGLSTKSGKAARAAGVLSASFSFCYALVIVAIVVITPYAAFEYFFRTFSGFAFEELYAANVFVLLVSLFTLVFCAQLLKSGSYAHLLGLLSVLSGLALLVFQTLPLFACTMAFTGAYAALLFRARFAYTALAFAACALFALLCFAINPEPRGNALVEKVLYPGLRRAIIGLFPDLPLLMDIPGYGLAYGTAKLGGSTLLTATPVMEVSSSSSDTLYLKTNAYDVYTGKSWGTSIDVPGRSLLTQEYAEPDPGDRAVYTDVVILSEAFFTVPFTLDTAGYKYGGRYYPVDGKTDWPGIVFDSALPKNAHVRLRRSDSRHGEPQTGIDYLQLPPGLPDEVGKLAISLSKGAGSPEEKLGRIREFLSYNNVYDLNAPQVGGNEDFVAKFLFDDNRGYCTHFASAFVVLARLMGINARYATGYLVYASGDAKKKLVTARSAHAWPEVYVPGLGWSAREATAAVNLDSYAMIPYGDIEPGNTYRYASGNAGIARNAFTRRQLEELLGIRLESGNEGDAQRSFTFAFNPWYLTVLAVPLLSLLAVILVRFISGIIRDLDPLQKARHRVIRIACMFKEVPPPEEGGWMLWLDNVRKRYGIGREDADELIGLILEVAYSSHTAGEEELARLVSHEKSLSKMLRNR